MRYLVFILIGFVQSSIVLSAQGYRPPEKVSEIDTQTTVAVEPTAGKPLSERSLQEFQLAIWRCWNVASLSADALEISVVVALSIHRDGRPDVGSIRMLDATEGPDGAIQQIYESARRAIIRCGATGYDLPVEKYEQWRDIEITFNPERMRIK